MGKPYLIHECHGPEVEPVVDTERQVAFIRNKCEVCGVVWTSGMYDMRFLEKLVLRSKDNG